MQSTPTRPKKPALTGLLFVIVQLVLMPQAQSRVLDDSGWVLPEVVEICRTMAEAHGLPIATEHESYSALELLHAFGEENLRRPEGSERLDDVAQESYSRLAAPLSEAQRRHLLSLFDALGDVGPVEPLDKPYDYIFIHGSTVPNMRRRLAALATCVENKAFAVGPSTQIIFFDGERPLYAKETLDVLLDPSPYVRDPTFTPPPTQPTDEREAAEMVYRQLWLPTPLRHAPAEFVHAPAEPGHTRAHTQDVVRYWLSTGHRRPGRALMVSDNPFVEYQRLATLLALKEAHGPAIDIVPMGPGESFEDALSDTALGVRLDNLAANLTLALKLRNLEEQAIQPALRP